MESAVKQRLVQFIKSMHMTQRAFEIRCGMSNGYVANIRKGIGEDYLLNIAQQFPQLNRAWLLFGEGKMLKTTSVNSGDITITGNGNTNIGHGQRNMPAIIEVKENGVEVECPNCGEVIEVTGGTVLAMVPKEITRKPDIDLEKWRHKHPQEMKKIDSSEIWGDEPFVVQVDTRAMEPDYREGTFLVLQPLPDISYATADGIAYVIDTMKPHTLFRNLTDKYDGTYLLTSNNDKRSSIRIKAEDIITVYDIVGSFRRGR